MRINRVITVVALGALALTACGSSSSTRTIESKDGKVTVNKDGKHATVSVNGEGNNKITFGDTKVPSGFPSDVPLPKGLTIKTAASGTRGSKAYYQFAYSIGSKSPSSIISAYKDQLNSAGFQTSDYNLAGGSVSGVQATGKGWTIIATSIGAGTGTDPVLSVAIRNS